MKTLLAIAFTSLCALAAAGCGKNLSNFTGTWKTSTTTSGDVSGVKFSNMTTGNTTVGAGTTSDLVVLDNCTCNTQWTLTSSTTATLNSGQKCDSCGGVSNIMWAAGTMTTTDGMNISYSYSGSGSYNGLATNFMSTGTGTKVAQ